MPSHDRRGRNEQQEHWTKLIRPMLETQAWRSLSTTAQALYPWLRLEWRGPRANNNGRITFSVRQAAHALGVSRNTAARAFHDLQAKGFIVMTSLPRLGVRGEAVAPEYELTEIALPHGGKPEGRRLYREWSEGRDFPVQRITSNNPSGRNKRKPRLQNDDASVIEIATHRAGLSQ